MSLIISLTKKQEDLLQKLKGWASVDGIVHLGSDNLQPGEWTVLGWLMQKGLVKRIQTGKYRLVTTETSTTIKGVEEAKEVKPTITPLLKLEDIPEKWKPYLVEEIEEYEGEQEAEDITVLLQQGPVLLKGIKGIGKSLLVANVAKKLNLPRFVLSCSKATDEEDVLGRYVDLGKFVDGVVTQAVRCAQEIGYAILVLEEVNAMHSGVSMVLHNLLDFNKMLVIPSTGEVLKVNGGGKLFIVATANLGYFGTLPMNQAFRSRFNEIYMGFPPTDVQIRILNKHVKDSEIAKSIVAAAEALRKASENRDIPDFPSVREEVMCARLYYAFKATHLSREKALGRAMVYTMVKFAEDKVQRATAKNLIKTASKVNVELN